MKATIEQLWETGRYIICYDGSDTERPTDFSDLKKCTNVLVGDKIPGVGREVLIDNSIEIVNATTVRHPMGGKMYVLEVY